MKSAVKPGSDGAAYLQCVAHSSLLPRSLLVSEVWQATQLEFYRESLVLLVVRTDIPPQFYRA